MNLNTKWRRSAAFAVLGLSLGLPVAQANGLLFDFGADATPTTGGIASPAITWNNVSSVGFDDFGVLEGLYATDGAASTINIQMVSRFNGANENGTTAVSVYPATATRDSLYGNTEVFNGIENITPIFKLTGLPAGTYTLTFYASRLGVTDNRETRYTVTGASESFVDLNVANNATNTARVSAVAPDTAGEITIALTPGPNNNNGNHFTYLGVLQIDASTGAKYLVDFGAGGTPTDVEETPATAAWNNVTATIGSNPAGQLDSLVTTNGTPTSMGLAILSRFNGANENGVTVWTNYPTTATRDSLFGNTEPFSGASNIFPSFKLTGLDTNYAYSFTFFGSRGGVTDVRQTRYTVAGATTASADLNASANTNNTATVSEIRPMANGEITISMAPGPNNNNGNHFTYLGILKVDFAPYRTPRVLVDFGAAGRPTDFGPDDPDNYWNNVTPAEAGSDTGAITNLVKTDGTRSGINLQMVSRFNGANENGTEAVTFYPIDATRDSLFGNTELFSGLENVTPIFKLTGLNPATAYSLQLYASRMGVGDNRETRYTVTGAAESTADLNVANNENEMVTISDVRPTAGGEVTIALTPGPNNDNGNHFVYLGVLQLDWAGSTSATQPMLANPSYTNGVFRVQLNGSGGPYLIERTQNFTSWTPATGNLTGPYPQSVEIPQTENYYFYRARVAN